MEPSAHGTRLLLVEDNPGDADLVRVALEDAPPPGIELTWVESLGEALRVLEGHSTDAVLLDLDLPDRRGRATLEAVLTANPECPVVVLTGLDDEATALEALRMGAQDYLGKGEIRGEALVRSVRYALERRRSRDRIALLNRLLRILSETNQMIVRKTASTDVLREATRIAVRHGGFAMGCAVRKVSSLGPLAWEGASDPLPVCARCWSPDGGLSPTGALGRAMAAGVPVHLPVPRSEAPNGSGDRGATCTAFPVRVHGVPEGAFGVMADFQEIDRAEVLQILEELARDVGYALEVVKNEELHRAAEAALRASERRYRNLFENNQAAVLRASVDGEVLDANEAAWRMLGGATEAELRAIPADRLHDNPEQRRSLLAALHEGTVRNREVVLRRLDGTTFEALLTATLVPGEGASPPTVESTFLDVSELKRAEEEIRQAQKLEAVGKLAGGVAHDFNNLLQAGLGLVDLLRSSDSASGVGRGTADELEAIFRRGAALTRRLLLFARQEGRDPRPIELNEVVQGLLQMLRRVLKENIDVRLALDPEPVRVLADGGQLEQVIINLVLNAADAMADGGTLTLRSGRSASRAWLSVEDTGAGIPKGVRDRIFEPFFTTKGPAGGTGLGLAVVHGIIADHGGVIEVESEEGRGTSFRVALPALGPTDGLDPRPLERAEPPTPIRGGGQLVLVVEDQEVVRHLLCHSLLSLGYRVIAAESAEEALDLNGPFDLLLSDVVLRGANGPRLARELRRRWPDLAIVLVSGYAEEDVMQAIGELEPLRFLPKPFDLNTLSAAVHAALHGAG